MTAARCSRRALCVIIPLAVASIAVSAQPVAAGGQDDGLDSSSSLLLTKRADRATTQALLIDGETPQGPIVLVFGALGVAIVCLIFAIVKVNVSSGKQLTEERQKAKTDLRLKGGNVSPTGSRTMLNSANRSPTTTPLVSRTDLRQASPASIVAMGKRSSNARPISHYNARGYSGSSVSRDSGGLKSNYTSYSGNSLAEIPMLSATGRIATTLSQYSTSSGEPSAQSAMGANRTPRPPMKHAPSGHRHSTSTVFRGTDLYLARTRTSSANPPVVNPSTVDATYSPRTGSPKLLTGAELKRYASDSQEHSRRNSAAGLLDDDPFSPLSPYHSAPSSADHSSGVLSPVTSHPLTPGGSRLQAPVGQNSAGSSSAGSSSASVSSGGPSKAYKASTYAPPYPAQVGSSSGDRSSTLRPGVVGPRPNRSADRSAGFFQYGANGPDTEMGQGFEQLRPGQLAQPVVDGNGRRCRRGQPAGGPGFI